MQRLGYLMVIFGFLAGALVAVVDKESVRWGYFTALLSIGAAGVVLIRLSERKKGRAEGKLTLNMQQIEGCLSRIVENITRLNPPKAEKQTIDIYDLRNHIDRLFGEDLMSFVNVRQSIAHVYGLQAYADVMSHFAAGERYLNRVWSASADGYIDEANIYLDKAHEQFVQSYQKVQQLTQ